MAGRQGPIVLCQTLSHLLVDKWISEAILQIQEELNASRQSRNEASDVEGPDGCSNTRAKEVNCFVGWAISSLVKQYRTILA
jgi:hypothetical protein